MTAHELAKQLLEMPDVPIVGMGTGQGGNERGNEYLSQALCAEIGYLNEPRGAMRVWFIFGETCSEQEARDSGWLTDA